MNSPIISLIISGVLASSLLLSGCSSSSTGSADELKKALTDLQSENEALKAQLNQTEAAIQAPNTTSAPTPQHIAFTDVDENVPHHENIHDLVKLGIFNELGSEFKPYESISRGEFILNLYKTYNTFVKLSGKGTKILPAPHAKPFFSDLPDTHPAYKAVQAISNAGIAVGYDDGTFKADQPMTREEMLGIKVGFDYGKPFPATDYLYIENFSDHKQVDKRFTGYVNMGDDTIHRTFGKVKSLKPKESLMRHEEAAALWSFGGRAHPNTASEIVNTQTSHS